MTMSSTDDESTSLRMVPTSARAELTRHLEEVFIEIPEGLSKRYGDAHAD
jgi:hypothetical protein